MDVDQLIEKALQCRERKDFAQAKSLLKEACALAPLRTDIREMLVYTIEESAALKDSEAGDGAKRAVWRAPSPRRRSLKLLFATLAAMVCLGCLTGLGFYMTSSGYRLPQRIGATDEPPPSGAPPEARPTPDPMVEKRNKLLEQAEGLAESEKYPEAIEAMERALATAPENPEELERTLAQWHYEIGKDLNGSGKFVEAAKSFGKAAGLDPENPEYYLRKGQAYFQQGRAEKGSRAHKQFLAADEALERAIELDPELLKAYETLAINRIAQGKQADGVRFLRKIIDIDPASREARKARDHLRSKGMTLE